MIPRINPGLYHQEILGQSYSRRKREEGRRKKEEGRRKREEGRRKREEGRRKREEGRSCNNRKGFTD
ncbi:hypothetical protein QUB56_15090 [Microcoleus sp. AR_TQ3_B6]|uniref:hypothetical protein n=1 Tax=Microcoleus sp. AR_TQ3_B6 TaxID=3055284 RepID=UPI002FCEA0CF